MAGSLPVQTLSLLITAALPNVSRSCRAALDVIAEARGRCRAEVVASKAHLRDRHQLYRLLSNEGLPGFEEIRSWVSILWWVLEAEHHNESLFRVAHRNHVHPAICYRTVKRTSGLHWSQVKERGPTWVLVQISRLQRRKAPGQKWSAG